ncbi:hypothetical protein ACWEF6_40900 [Amycolatopsis sp. NPDC004772]
MTAVQVDDPVAGTDWVARAATVRVPEGLFVAGEPREAAGTREVRSARDGALLTELSWLDAGGVGRSVAAALACSSSCSGAEEW